MAVAVRPVGVSHHLGRPGGTGRKVDLHHVAASSPGKVDHTFRIDRVDESVKRDPSFANKFLHSLILKRNALGK